MAVDIMAIMDSMFPLGFGMGILFWMIAISVLDKVGREREGQYEYDIYGGEDSKHCSVGR